LGKIKILYPQFPKYGTFDLRQWLPVYILKLVTTSENTVVQYKDVGFLIKQFSEFVKGVI